MSAAMKIDIPIQQGLICQRAGDGDVAVNVPLYVVHHSPTGWEWGYGGSGPADLALNTVQHILLSMGYSGRVTKAINWYKPPVMPIFVLTSQIYQAFKFKFVAPIPFAGGTVPYADMTQWISLQIVEKG